MSGFATTGMILYRYHTYHHTVLLIIAIGNFFSSFIPFVFFGHYIFENSEYNSLQTSLARLALSFVFTAFYLYINAIKRLAEAQINWEDIVLFLLYILGLILIHITLKHEYDDGQWEISWSPRYFFYLFSLISTYMQLRIWYMVYKLVKHTAAKKLSLTFYFLVSIFLLVTPIVNLQLINIEILPRVTAMMPILTFYTLLTAILIWYPLVLFSSNISPNFIMLIDQDKRTIQRLYTFHERDNRDQLERSSTLPLEFYNFLEEHLRNPNYRTKRLELEDIQFYFYYVKSLQVVFCTSKSTISLLKPLEVFVSLIAEKMDIQSLEEIDFDSFILQSFQHQLLKLNLQRSKINPTNFDKTIVSLNKNKTLQNLLHPIRLGILQILYKNNQMMRSQLEKLMSINAGTLKRHIEKLKEMGFLNIQYLMVEDKPRMTVDITMIGISSFDEFKNHMKVLFT